MIAIRTLAAAVLAGTLLASGAHARTDHEAVVRLMAECARIGEIGARVACYDKTIEAAQLIAAAATVQAEPKIAAPAPAERPPAGFGAESLPKPEPVREARPAEEIEARVRTARQTEPGLYLLTLEDGAQWRFADAAPPSYDPPRAGSKIVLRSGALGSFLMRYADQRSLRIQRVR
ncbi:hypothetical protein GRI75_07495 [Altererythrobacter soli]|uniref:Uncharacterized protein n=1 Tax=Croceibacterium soli TaxID=1739690 RepID=A0A6I4USP9_9SPHN|nr:hypothetical protein [Croceibacterium soli]MXP41486.1 hypothetical protein [Croceibacterium soli]